MKKPGKSSNFTLPKMRQCPCGGTPTDFWIEHDLDDDGENRATIYPNCCEGYDWKTSFLASPKHYSIGLIHKAIDHWNARSRWCDSEYEDYDEKAR